MPLLRSEVTVGSQTFVVRPFLWPVAPLRVGVHVVQAGRLIEVDSTTRLQDVDVLLEGDETTGWATMTNTVKAAIEALFQAGAAFMVSDWRGNTGTFFFLEPPTFEDVASDEAAPLTTTYWTFRLRLGRST